MKFFDLHCFKPILAKVNVKSKLSKSDDNDNFMELKSTIPISNRKNTVRLMAQGFYNSNIKSYGCLFLSLIYKANPVLLTLENAPAVERIYNELIMQHFMRSDCYIYNRNSVLRHICKYYGGVINRDVIIKKNLVKYSTNDHFVVTDNMGSIIYDPYIGGEYGKSKPIY